MLNLSSEIAPMSIWLTWFVIFCSERCANIAPIVIPIARSTPPAVPTLAVDLLSKKLFMPAI